MENINYENIEAVGIELLRKNNNTFYRSNLSKQMEKIFLAANKDKGITSINNEYYMKSSNIPDRIYYIYSDQLNNLAKDKIFDIVLFKNKPCLWIYSINAIDMIGEDPINTIDIIYRKLLFLFKQNIYGTFIEEENKIVHTVMCIRLLKFLSNTYGLIDFEDCKKKIAIKCWRDPITHNSVTKESLYKFIDDIDKNHDYENKYYYTNREYLDSYMLLENEEDNTVE